MTRHLTASASTLDAASVAERVRACKALHAARGVTCSRKWGSMYLQSTFMEALEGAAARDAGAAVQANTLSKKTKAIYCCALKALQVFGNSIEEISEDPEIFDSIGELVVPMPMRLVELYFGHLAAKRVPWIGGEKHLSVSSISVVTSAITSLHKANRVKVNDDVDVYMKQFVKGYKRTIAEKKQANEYPMMEGKAFLGKDGLTALIEEGIKLGPGLRRPGGEVIEGE